MKNKKEVSEKVKAILRDGRESKLYQHVIADMHGVCQAYVCKLFKKHKVRVKEQRVFTQGEPVRFHVGWQVEILKNGVHFGYMKHYKTFKDANRGAQNKCYRMNNKKNNNGEIK
jgi:hypothetical protein